LKKHLWLVVQLVFVLVQVLGLAQVRRVLVGAGTTQLLPSRVLPDGHTQVFQLLSLLHPDAFVQSIDNNVELQFTFK
jgi:hypothetical protein